MHPDRSGSNLWESICSIVSSWDGFTDLLFSLYQGFNVWETFSFFLLFSYFLILFFPIQPNFEIGDSVLTVLECGTRPLAIEGDRKRLTFTFYLLPFTIGTSTNAG